MHKLHIKPGQIVARSGQAEIIDANGHKTGVERTLVEGHPAPPTPKKGQIFEMVDLTQHKTK